MTEPRHFWGQGSYFFNTRKSGLGVGGVNGSARHKVRQADPLTVQKEGVSLLELKPAHLLPYHTFKRGKEG